MGDWNSGAYQERLAKAVTDLDRVHVAALCNELLDHLASRVDAYPDSDARRHLKTLRNKRFFDHVIQLADRLLRKSPGAPWIRRDLAQAHLDRSQVMTAIAVLKTLLGEKDLPDAVRCEAVGLLGRAHKQIYVDGNSRDAIAQASLRESIDRYYEIYSSNCGEHLWHGINVVSLLCRAERDGITGFDKLPTAKALATDILAVIEKRESEHDDPLPPWDLATAAEAHIALGDYVAAGKRLFEYAKNKTADAFELGSTYRQLTQVVQLDQREGDARFLVDIVRGELLQRETGRFELTAEEVRERALSAERVEQGLEAVLGDESYLRLSWLLTGFKRAAAVARIKRAGGTRGTGFVMHGSVLHQSWDHQVLLTNNHVLSQKPVIQKQMRPQEVEISFDGLDEKSSFRVKGPPLFESRYDELDVTIVRLDRDVQRVEPFRIAEQLPEMCEPPPRMCIIGHPNGAELAFSLADNRMIEITERRIHYRSPTDPGSSGSPVFDVNWDLVAIHRRGDKDIESLSDPSKTHDANEGVPILTIAKAIAAVLKP